MVDVSIIPMSSTSSKLRATRQVPANQMTTAQHQVIQEVWNSIQLARASTKMNTDDLEDLEERFETLTEQLNIAYRKVTEDMTGGMTYLHQNLHGLATQARQFSSLVHQQHAQTADGEEKIVALQVANKSNNDNLEILAQIVQAEAKKRNEHDSHLETWARKKNQEVSALKSNTTLTKGQVARLQEQLREEQAFRLNNQANHDKDIARLEEQIIKAIEGAASLEKAKEVISVNLMQARASSASMTAEIRARMAQLGKKKQRPTVAALFSEEEEFLRAQKERLEALKETAGGSGGTLPLPPGGRANPDPSHPGDDDDDDNGSAPSRRRGGAPSRSPSPPRHFHRPTPEDLAQAKREKMQTFAEIIAMALAAQPKEDDTGKRLPVKAPDTYDRSFVKFRRWWESIDEYFAIHWKRVPTDETKIYSVGTFLRDQASDWYMERKQTKKTLHLEDNWKAFSMAIEERFTDRQEQGKDHEKLFALEYQGDMQTYLAKFNELHSRVSLSGQAMKRILTTAITPDMYKNIWRKHGCIPDNDADLLNAVREAGIEEEELARALVAKKSMARPQKEKEKDAAPKGEQQPVKGKEKEKAPEKASGSTGPAVKDKYPDQEIRWGSFSEATKGVPENEFTTHQEKDADCRRCGRDGHKTRACYAQTTIAGTKLAPQPKLPSGKASAAGTKRTAEADPEPEKEEEKITAITREIKKARTAATQRKV